MDMLGDAKVLWTGSGEWVAPKNAQILQMPTDAFAKLHGDLEELCVKAGLKLGQALELT